MSVRLIAEICAGIAVVATIVRMILNAKGIKLLRDIRDQNKNHSH